MREELQILLEKEFPFMKRRKTYEEQTRDGLLNDLYGAFGCEFGDGWYSVIKGLCSDITQAYAEEGKAIDLIPMQVKEKFGTLRFYYRFDGGYTGNMCNGFYG